MPPIVRTRLTLRLAQLALLSATACSDAEHRLGGAFPANQGLGGTGGLATNPIGGAGSGAGNATGGRTATAGDGGKRAVGGGEDTAGNDGGGFASGGLLGIGGEGNGAGVGAVRDPGERAGGDSGGNAGFESGGTGGVTGGGTSAAGGDGGTNSGGDGGTSAAGGDGGTNSGGSGVGVLLKVIAVAVGPTNSCALLSSKAVRCWGSGGLGANGYGNTNNIGDNETPASAGDVTVGGPIKQIAVGGAHACALLDSGAVRCWGQGRYGKLGYGNTNDIGDNETPASVGDVEVGGTVVQLSMGRDHSCALLDTGGVRCWGDNSHGQLGHGNTTNIGDDESPSMAGDAAVGGAAIQISAGDSTTCALLTTGSVRCWGQGFYGELGYGNINDIGDDETPASAGDVNIGGRVVQISVGGNHACALLESGNVRCWGVGASGALGYGNTNWIGDDETPATAGDVDVGGVVAEVAAGSFPTCALLNGGSVRCWGDGAHVGTGLGKGGLGYANTNNIGDNESPASVGDVDIGGLVTQIAASYDHVCALLTTGGVRCWGSSGSGELGYGNTNAVGDDEVPASVGDVPVILAGELVGGGGSSGGEGGGGFGGAIAGAGAPGTCVGSCSSLSALACSSVPQCTIAGSCDYIGGATLCGIHTTEGSCVSAQWCVWVGGSLGCRTSADMCPTLYPTPTACQSSAAGSIGCVFQASGCSGSLNCTPLNQQQCGATAGCSWTNG